MTQEKQLKMLLVGTIILCISLITINAIESAMFPLPEFIIEYEYRKTQKIAAKIDEYRMKSELKNGKININTATIEEFDILPGIGEVTAKVIVEFREDNGPFPSINHLLDVPRIGEKTLDKIRPYITLGENPKDIIKNNN